MKISSEFSKYAFHYGAYNIIQNRVVQRLISSIKDNPKYILDLGCGSGAVVKHIEWEIEFFLGVDFAMGMLELHPTSSKIQCIYGDFNNQELFKELQKYKFDYIISASALQWANDLEIVLKNIAALKKPVALAIFTSGTFKTLNKTANLEPLLQSAEYIELCQKRYLEHTRFEVVEYRLEFENVREMFQYIKKSGVSGSRKSLSYKEMKRLMREYPLPYLEFEVAFITH
jgi:malonyl-CoA O-methyltransferase